MKKRTLSVLACALSLLCILSACSTKDTPAPSGAGDVSTSTGPLTLSSQSTLAESAEDFYPLNGDAPSTSSVRISVATPKIETPLTDGTSEARAEVFNTYMSARAEAFVSEYTALLSTAEESVQLLIEMNPVIARNDGAYLSVFFQGYVNQTGIAYPQNLVASENFRVSEEAIEPLPFAALFSVSEEEALALVQEKLFTLASTFDQNMLREQFNPSNFYLTDASLVVYYPEGSLGSHALGIPSFSIPLSELADILA